MSLSFEIPLPLVKSLRILDAKALEKSLIISALSEEEQDFVGRQARISTIGASTRIENAVLTDVEVDWIDTELATDGRPTAFAARRTYIEDKIAKDRTRSLEEVAGCREMLAVIFDQARDLFPLTETAIRGLHQELLKYYPAAAYHLGRYKLSPNRVVERDHGTGAERTVLAPTEPGPLTDSAMADLVAWYNTALPSSPWPVAVAAEFVFRFLAIHPFQDGNGRLGRGLFLLSLLQAPDDALAKVAPYLALDRQLERRKGEYYTSLARCSGGQFSPDPRRYRLDIFLRFMVKAIDAALDDIDFYRQKHAALLALAPSSAAVLRCFKDRPESRLKTGEIVAATLLPRRTVVHSLAGLTRAGFLQRYGQGAGTRYQIIF